MKFSCALSAKIEFTVLSLRHNQIYVISGLAKRAILLFFRVAFCSPIFSQYVGMDLPNTIYASARKIYILRKSMNTMNVTMTSNVSIVDSIFYSHYVNQVA